MWYNYNVRGDSMKNERVYKDWTLEKIKQEYEKVANIYTLSEFIKNVVFEDVNTFTLAFIDLKKIEKDVKNY